ncbi:MAG: class II fructose-bisphosphate aldolase [Candidatus Omnitrophica bacterium]|nr:class II fructose-bisphosphate aldolase [Candidatus Omnitrophota bacterium]MDD5429697.1 class II fructose-bisphosphate aldolase [Candidatus Omnitrophota bacterium]
MVYSDESQILNNEAIQTSGEKITVTNPELFRSKIIDNLIDTIILSESLKLKQTCYWLAYESTLQLGVVPSSIQGLYEAMGKGKAKGFTVPAMNIRTLTFDLCRAVFRAAAKINANAFIFEIAKSEIGYTAQRPIEYSTMIALAALKEGYKGPIFIQGDHFQIKAKNFLSDTEKELNQLKVLIKEAIEAGFYNIDIDSSTLVDLSKPELKQQQELNYQVCAFLTRYIRQLQPEGIEVSVGGEIGEVGGKNSTPQELIAFMEGYQKEIKGSKGISKISIQTGTSHGGVVLPDGSIAKVSIDFDTLGNLSGISREKYQMAGAVQHGASTLPNEAFHRFPGIGCAEIHLATQFQNIVYDYLPLPIKEKIYSWLHAECANEKKTDWTDDQFIYKTRKKAFGPFKRDIYSLPGDVKSKISSVLEEEFSFLFDQLNIKDTCGEIQKYTKVFPVKKSRRDFFTEEQDLGHLEGAD